MGRHWAFGTKVGASFGLLVALALLMGFVAFVALRTVISTKDEVIDVDAQLLIDAQRVHALGESVGSDARGFLLTNDEQLATAMQSSAARLVVVLERLRRTVATSEARAQVDAIAKAAAAYQDTVGRVVARRRTAESLQTIVREFEEQIRPLRGELDAAIQTFVTTEERRLQAAKQASTVGAEEAIGLTAMLVGILAVCAIVAGVLLTRALARQIGTAVGQVQSSSAELQAAATQQATGAKEQSTAMTEIATTISELLATSRQITESAQRVARIAEETAGAARSGDETVDQAHESIAAIRRQVDLIVSHMLELGRKSQQIGTVLDIVSELAEQTNILAINATIEAAGAGETGRRFAVVADEIRKLADRVAGSTKEIRGLIEDVRGAVNTTVMTTETGSKAVDTGSKQFAHVTASFKQIVGLVTTTTEAAREIELSIKQQMSAVEQVNVAVSNIAQASKETEASTGQTQQTASELALLSRDLLKVIRPESVA